MNEKRREEPRIRGYIESRIEEDISKINHNIDQATGMYFWINNLHNRTISKTLKDRIIVPAKIIDDPRQMMETYYMNDFIDSISRVYEKNLRGKISGEISMDAPLVPPTKTFDEQTARKYVASFGSNSNIDHLILEIPYKHNEGNVYSLEI